MKIVFCGFGNPDNRGCEAIIRTVSNMTNEAFPNSEMIAMSNDYGKIKMPDISIINEYKKSFYPHPGEFATYVYYGLYKIFGNAKLWCNIQNNKTYKEIGKADICVSIGGDNFCYNDRTDCLTIHHSHFKKEGAKLIHWGSSFEEKLMYPRLVDDLNQFDVIMVRESISYQTLINAGIKSKVYMIPDPAFTMETKRPKDMDQIPEGWIGLNVSPMVVSKEHHSGAVKKNIINLVNYIIDECGDNILLIPHVCDRKTGAEDYAIMREFLNEVSSPDKCKLVGYQYNAMEYKYIISKCRLFIGARTHSTIAAYSTCVPTLTIGYSVKAKGIARDLYGTEETYVQSTQNLKSDLQLVEAYKWLNANETEIRTTLKKVMPEYIKTAHSAVDIMKEVYYVW